MNRDFVEMLSALSAEGVDRIAPSRIDLLTGVSGVTFEDVWASRISVTIEGIRVPVIGFEELLRNKEASGRPQDLADAAWLRSRKK